MFACSPSEDLKFSRLFFFFQFANSPENPPRIKQTLKRCYRDVFASGVIIIVKARDGKTPSGPHHVSENAGHSHR
jgi:hypothetical protein